MNSRNKKHVIIIIKTHFNRIAVLDEVSTAIHGGAAAVNKDLSCFFSA